MLAEDASLAEIGQVLRHRRPQTTAACASPRELHQPGGGLAGPEGVEPVLRTSTIAQVQNACSSPEVRSRRFPARGPAAAAG